VLSESLTLCRETGDELGIGAAKGYLGIMATYAGEIDAARSYLEDALFLLRARGGTDEIMRCIGFLAHLACDTDDPATARARFRELASLDPLTTVPYTAGFVLQGVARLAVVEKNPELSLKLAGAAASTHERIGTSAGPAYDAYVGRGMERPRSGGRRGGLPGGAYVDVRRGYGPGYGRRIISARGPIGCPSPTRDRGLAARRRWSLRRPGGREALREPTYRRQPLEFRVPQARGRKPDRGRKEGRRARPDLAPITRLAVGHPTTYVNLPTDRPAPVLRINTYSSLSRPSE
jgi:hypothetical protein